MKTNMSKLTVILFVLSLCFAVVQPIQVDAAKAKATVQVKNSRGTILKGNEVKLTATLKNGKLKKVRYKSLTKDLATVNTAGRVRGKKAGTALIEVTVTSTKGQTYKSTVKVFVRNRISDRTPNVELSGLETITRGNKAALTYQYNKNKIQKVTYKSNNKSVATVNTKGVITAKNAGTANITVTVTDKAGYTSKSTKKITVPGNVLTRSGGINYYNGSKETWYTQRMFPGAGLSIPGRHVRRDGVICDGDGYVVVALPSGNKGQIVETSLGTGKCYDTNPGGNSIDIYTNW